VTEELLMRGAAVVAVDQSRSMLDEIDKKWDQPARSHGDRDGRRPSARR